MKQFKVLLLSLVLLSWLTACTQLLVEQTEPGSVARPAVYLQYHVWYKTADNCPSSNPASDWYHWVSPGENNNPCNTPFAGAPWLRDTSSPGYMLLGPYKSSNEEVFRWHIRLAKAAGIDGFFVSVFPGVPETATLLQNFDTILKVAFEENFRIGLESWYPQHVTVDQWVNGVKSILDHANASPYSSALLKFKGKPAYWFVYWNRFMPLNDLISRLLNARSGFWVIGGPLSMSELQSVRSQLTLSEVTQVTEYNRPSSTGCITHDIVAPLGELRANGFLALSHGYPGFDERLLPHIPGFDSRYCLRNNGQTAQDLLNSSVQGKADAILFESWNDYMEYTQFEPGLDVKQYRDVRQELIYNSDPYKYLKILANFKGVTFVAPTLTCKIVDPLLQPHGVVECSRVP